MSHDSRPRFSPFSTKYTSCSIRSAVALRRADLDADGCVEQLVRELADVVGERGREQQVLALLRQQRDDAADVGQETHVEHAVGFVEHEDLDVPQIDVALRRVIEQPARRRDEHVDAAAQLAICGLMLTPPKIDGRLQRHVLAVVAHALLDLRRELARRREDQCADAARPFVRRRRGARHEPLQQRQREAGRLAGAGLRAGHDVAPFEHDGNDATLDRRGLRVALFRNATQQRGRKAERIERHVNKLRDRPVHGAVRRPRNGQGDRILEADTAGIGYVASSADRMCARDGAALYHQRAAPAVIYYRARCLRRSNVPPLAQLAAETAAVERQNEHAIELDAYAARGRLQARRPTCDARLAVDGHDLRLEVDVALVGGHRRPIVADTGAAGFRRVERHLVIRRVLGEQCGRLCRIALFPRLLGSGRAKLRPRPG